ncbi:MAG: hypothetical protein WAS73_00675 [Defluviicoccus sp.]
MRDICRRDAMRALVCSALVLTVLKRPAIAPARAVEPTDQPLAFEWWVPANQVEIVRNNLAYQGQERPQTDGRGIPILVVFVGLALLAYLAKAILALQRQIAYGGVVVDTRGDPVPITVGEA